MDSSKRHYYLKDISLVIATYNRADDLLLTLTSFRKYWGKLGEIIIVDQSTNNETEEGVRSLKIPDLVYIKLDQPSLTKARNYGIKKTKISTQITGFLDDDVSIGKGYFEEIVRIFNTYDAKGVGGWYLPPLKIKKYEQTLKKFFLLEHLEPGTACVKSVYGQVYPSTLKQVIKSDWLSGFNMFFKKEIFKEFTFDECLSRYALAEDFDFTYRVHKRHMGALFLTPFAHIIHRASIIERYPTKKAAYMNQIHKTYLNFKNFNSTIEEKLGFVWAVLGLFLLRTLQIVKGNTSTNRLKLKLFLESLFFSLSHLSSIRKGHLKELIPD